jgi:hypothetical protein
MNTILLLQISVSISQPDDICSDQFCEDPPLTLSTSQLVFDIVDGVSWSGITLDITSIFELGAEYFIVWVGGNIVDDNVLAVIGDLVDDELGLSTAHAKVVECSDALILDSNSIFKVDISN